MKKTLAFLLLLAIIIMPANAVEKENVKPVKNVILLIPDGTSLATISIARWLQWYQDPSKPKLNIDPYLCGTVRTHSSNAPIGDSAPTTSCYMTGQPSRTGYVSTYPGLLLVDFSRYNPRHRPGDPADRTADGSTDTRRDHAADGRPGRDAGQPAGDHRRQGGRRLRTVGAADIIASRLGGRVDQLPHQLGVCNLRPGEVFGYSTKQRCQALPAGAGRSCRLYLFPQLLVRRLDRAGEGGIRLFGLPHLPVHQV